MFYSKSANVGKKIYKHSTTKATDIPGAAVTHLVHVQRAISNYIQNVHDFGWAFIITTLLTSNQPL